MQVGVGDRAAMGKNIVICCDGTGNEVVGNPTNVLKLFRIVQKNDQQCVFYHPGIGTVGSDDAWAKISQNTKGVFGLASGYGLDDEILGAYRFLGEHYQEGDHVFLFGFSRGAYTVRALAGFVHVIGLLPVDQLNIANYALSAYKKSVESPPTHDSGAHEADAAHAGTILNRPGNSAKRPAPGRSPSIFSASGTPSRQ
jgi:uncharacterized protein (DUF2235 family)